MSPQQATSLPTLTRLPAFKMSVSKIMLLVEKLSASEKLQLNEQLAASMVGQTTQEKPVKVSSRKGKPAPAGTKAWTAFIAHAKETMPERFAPPALPKDRMAIAKAIKEENPEAYKAFCEKFLAASDVEADAPVSPAPTPVDAPVSPAAAAASPAPAPAPAAAAASPAPAPAPAPSPAPVADDAKAAAKAKAMAAKAARTKKVAA